MLYADLVIIVVQVSQNILLDWILPLPPGKDCLLRNLSRFLAIFDTAHISVLCIYKEESGEIPRLRGQRTLASRTYLKLRSQWGQSPDF